MNLCLIIMKLISKYICYCGNDISSCKADLSALLPINDMDVMEDTIWMI